VAVLNNRRDITEILLKVAMEDQESITIMEAIVDQ
jgi:hypothetical protein